MNTSTAVVTVFRPLLRAAVALRASLRRRAAARKQAREDNEFWKLALKDQRVMSDISRDVSSGTWRAMERLP
jgi:hypothetical protein